MQNNIEVQDRQHLGHLAFRPARTVADLRPYRESESTPNQLPHPERIAKLDGNECVRPPSPRVREALEQYASAGRLNWYPDREAGTLCHAISNYTGCHPEEVRVCGGAWEYLTQVFLDSSDEVVASLPVSERIRVAVAARGAMLRLAPTQSIWEPEPGSLLAAVTPQTRMVYLANPSNPTGTLYSTDQIAALLWTCPDVGFVIDESYCEFSGLSAASLVAAHQNLIVIRSFAKAFGLAGMGIAYLLSHPDNLRTIDRVRSGRNVSDASQVAAVAALGDLEYMHETVNQTRSAMQQLSDSLRTLGLPVRTTPANFILVRVREPETLCRFLANRLIFVHNCHDIPQLEGYIRITVGDPGISERLIAAFRAAPAQLLIGETGPRRLKIVRGSERSMPEPVAERMNSVGTRQSQRKTTPTETTVA